MMRIDWQIDVVGNVSAYDFYSFRSRLKKGTPFHAAAVINMV